MASTPSGISLSPPRGMLDYPPKDMQTRVHVHDALKKICKAMGFSEYDIPIVEHWETFAEKSSEELISQQSYHFADRGDRKLILRPEITPCLARLVAKEMGSCALPLRWFTIGRCYRYEKPQKGRLREFHQLNIDILDKANPLYDVELLQAAQQIMQHFDLSEDSYHIDWNHRGLANALLTVKQFNEKQKNDFFALVDRCEKLTKSVLLEQLSTLFTNEAHKEFFTRYINYNSLEELLNEEIGNTNKQDEFIKQFSLEDLLPIATTLSELSSPLKTPSNNTDTQNSTYRFNPHIVRGFNYYTGLVFEVFEAKGSISRSIFGGGRYGNLIAKYAGKPLSGVGLGMGTHIFSLLLQHYEKTPQGIKTKTVLLASLDSSPSVTAFCFKASRTLQAKNYVVNISPTKNIRAAFKKAEQQGCTHIAIVGSNEATEKNIALKDLESGEVKKIDVGSKQ